MKSFKISFELAVKIFYIFQYENSKKSLYGEHPEEARQIFLDKHEMETIEDLI